MRIIYFMLVAAAVLFAIQYRPALSVALLISLIVFPFVLGIMYFYASRRMSASLSIETTSSSAGQDIPLKLEVKNPTIIPIGTAEILLEIRLSSAASPETVRINTPVFPRNDQVLTTTFSSEHFGIVNIRLKRVTVSDMLKLTRFRLRKKAVSCETGPITVLPVPSELDSAISDYSDLGLESDVFSGSKPGDDPSEIFAIRDYNDGDKMSRIHWKLSAKEDKLMVKDYSLPLFDSCLIICDNYADPSSNDSAQLYDTVIETVISLSLLLNEHAVRHRIACYNHSSDELTEMPVFNDDDYIAATASLLDCGICKSPGLAAEAEILREQTGMRFGHLILVCSKTDGHIVSALADSGIAMRYTVLLCTASDSPSDTADILRLETDTEVVRVISGDIVRSLADFTV